MAQATPELVAAFLAELAEEGKSVSTLRLTKSALAAVHRSTGHQNPTDNEGVRKVMAGLARANGRPQRQAKPLTETALAAVKATAGIPRRYRDRAVRAENAWAARRRGQVDIALLSVLRDGILRRSEAAALRWGDVEIQGRGSARLHVRRSKTDPEAEGAALYIGSDAAFGKPEVYEYLEQEMIGYAIRLSANAVLQREIAHLLVRPADWSSRRPIVSYYDFTYQAQSWSISRRVVAKVEWHQGELFPRVGFIVTNLSYPPKGIVRFYNGRGTAEQWIKEGKYALNWMAAPPKS